LSCRAALLTVTFALLACRSRGPDANYQQAFTIYQQLYATELDDAYGDARMNDVVALLRKVDPRSGDAERATALLGTIERGKEAFAQQQAEREKRSAAITQSATAPQFEINPSKILAANEPDAGQQVQDPFGPGASVADLNASHGGCLQDNEPFNEQGTGVSGTVYRVAPSDSCRSKLPGQACSATAQCHSLMNVSRMGLRSRRARSRIAMAASARSATSALRLGHIGGP